MTAPPPGLGLLRFLRAAARDTTVLNDGDPAASPAQPRDAAEIAGGLMRAARALIAWPGRGRVPYARIAASSVFSAYREQTLALRHLDPAMLGGASDRIAFWINVYNALVIDAVISFGVRDSVREVPGFFHRAAYRIGGYRFALDDIEHGLLRANLPRHPRLPVQFSADDPRRAFGVTRLDPRMHFALNCGTRSCPMVAFYEAEHLDEQLDAAATSFIQGDGVRLRDGTAWLSPLFAYYLADFGGEAGACAWVMRYLDDPIVRDALAAGPVRFGVYDWALNGESRSDGEQGSGTDA